MRARTRRRHPAPVLERLVAVPGAPGPRGPVDDLVGCDPGGSPVRVALGAGAVRTLLLFLTTGCDGCRPFWPAAEGDPVALGLAAGDRVVVVARDPACEDGAMLARLAGAGCVVMSSAAWDRHRVSGPPFYVLVGPGGQGVVTEGVAFAVAQVAEDVRRAAEAG